MSNKRPVNILLTCEHASCNIDEKYKDLNIPEKVLFSHQGYDIGARELCEKTFQKINAKERPVSSFYGNQSRLLVDLNRSLHHRALFSQYSRNLPAHIRKMILEKEYRPWRENVLRFVREKNRQGIFIIHFSIHSFTPELDGKIRNASLGILYDPSRRREKEIARALKQEILFEARTHAPSLPGVLLKELLTLPVRMNYPYRGTADGHTPALRKEIKNELYAGLEIEVNQKYLGENSEIFIERLSTALASFLGGA